MKERKTGQPGQGGQEKKPEAQIRFEKLFAAMIQKTKQNIVFGENSAYTIFTNAKFRLITPEELIQIVAAMEQCVESEELKGTKFGNLMKDEYEILTRLMPDGE